MQKIAWMLALVLGVIALAGCVSDDQDDDPMEPSPTVEDPQLRHVISSTGRTGPEPSIGVTSDGCIFVTTDVDTALGSMPGVSKSCDHGETWEGVAMPPITPINDNDPYLWVDAVTDRIYLVAMQNLVCTWIAWSDDGGDSWLSNPVDCGPLPVNDHIKVATGPWTSAAPYGTVGSASPLYENAVYFCYNKLVAVFCYTSFDGGVTFPIGGQIAGLATTGAGLHGAIETAPDGTVYVPPRVETPTLLLSKDNGLTWTSVSMGQDVGTPEVRKNSEVATDTASNAYHVWTGGDQGVYLSRSTDSGATWDSASLRISPDNVISTAFPHIDAGDPGRIAIAYLGSNNSEMLGEEDIDGNAWEGNGQFAPAGVFYQMYLTYSTNALDDEPTWNTVQITKDPVQIGSICLNSSDCRDIGGSNRNLLDFNDLHIGPDGRMHLVYTDGCVDACADDWQNKLPEDSRSRIATVAILEEGPSLYESVGVFEGF